MTLAPRSYVLEYPYTRTVGPVVGKFLTGLRDGRLFGIRCRGKVICPPIEFDPETGETLALDFAPVGPGGRVESWSWIAEPTRKHPFQRPFAFALIRLDGADTALVHAVAAEGPDAMVTGMRVRAQYREERKSAITDVYFVPEADAALAYVPPGQGDVAITDHLISLQYDEPLTAARERYAQGLLAGRFIGQKSPKSGKVFVPSSGYDPLSRVLLSEADDVELPPTGTVVGFTVITPVQYYGQKETEPYIRASILLDGADTPLGQQDIRDIPVAEFRVGLRVRAEFRPREARSVDELTNRWAGTGSCITVKPAAGVECAKALYKKAGITDPRRQIDCAELYVPFSWYEPMWLEGHLLCEEGEGWKLTDSGATELGGDFPVNMSGGVLSSNPIGASGMIRCLEAASQVRGTAGDYQVDGARVALGHAYGGGANYFAMWIVSSEPAPTF